MDALFESTPRVEQELNLRCACQVALLRDRLQACGVPESVVQPIVWLRSLSVADLTRLATPFFWRNLLRCHAACRQGGVELNVALRDLAMTGFDSFFSARRMAWHGRCRRGMIRS